MTTALILLGIAWIGLGFVVWSCCVVAGEYDRRTEELERRRQGR